MPRSLSAMSFRVCAWVMLCQMVWYKSSKSKHEWRGLITPGQPKIWALQRFPRRLSGMIWDCYRSDDAWWYQTSCWRLISWAHLSSSCWFVREEDVVVDLSRLACSQLQPYDELVVWWMLSPPKQWRDMPRFIAVATFEAGTDCTSVLCRFFYMLITCFYLYKACYLLSSILWHRFEAELLDKSSFCLPVWNPLVEALPQLY